MLGDNRTEQRADDMRRTWIAVAAVVVLGGAAYYGLSVVPSQQLRAGLDQTIATLPAGWAVKYGGASYSLLSHTATITDLSIEGPPSYPLNETIAKVKVERPALDLVDQWNKAQANPSALKPDQALPVADRVTVEGVKFSGNGTSGTIANSSFAKLRIYPWPFFQPGVPPLKDFGQIFMSALETQKRLTAERQALLAQVQKIDSKPSTLAPLAEPTPADFERLQKDQLDALLPLVRLEAVTYLGVGFDGFDSSGLDVTGAMQATAAMPSGGLHVAMSKMHLNAFDRAIGGGSTIDGLVEELGPSLKMAVDHASLGNMVLRDTAMRLVTGAPLTMALLDGSSFEGMELDGMSISLPTGGSSQIQKIALSNLAFDHSFLKSFGFSIIGLKQDVAGLAGQPKATLQQLGLSTLTINIATSFQWDAGEKTAAIHDNTVSIDELGSLHLDADLVNIGPPGAAGPEQPDLGKAALRYQDGSLINRLLSAGGKRTPEQLAQMRQAFAANLLGNLGPIATDPKLAASVKAINDFAKMPQSLTITLAPPAPVPLAAMKTLAAQGPQALVDTLGLSITANQ
jgi:hypothetical protein